MSNFATMACITGLNYTFFLISILISGTLGRECFTAGECRDSYPLTGSIVDNQFECRKQCQSTSNCAWFSFYQQTSYCRLFKNCVKLNDSYCSDCFRGAKDCLASGLKCRMVGKCKEDPLFTVASENEDDCLENCKANTTCKWFTFDKDAKSCSSYSACESLTSCDTCKSGNSKCSLSTSESEWHLILGGAGSFNTAELFNWHTNQQCRLPDLPVGVFGHVAASMEGTPVFCEAGAVQKGCYKMDKTSKKWVSISSLLSPVEYGKSVYVPSQGWVVFGRLGNDLETAQLLTSPDGTWKAGPKLFKDFHKEIQCIVQVDDINTMFFDNHYLNETTYDHFGDSHLTHRNYLRILSLDWSTMAYTERQKRFEDSSKVSFPTCTLVKGDQDEFDIAITRGTMYYGMETYSKEGNFKSDLSDVLPPEVKYNGGLGFGQLMSINNGTDLILYGGQIGEEIQDGIWRFSLTSRRWVKVGKMMFPRSAHTVVPVTGLSCD